jgi:ParB family chromosome partitioning protein
MQFPPAAYTERGGVGTVAAHAKVGAARDMIAASEPDEGEEPFAEAA